MRRFALPVLLSMAALLSPAHASAATIPAPPSARVIERQVAVANWEVNLRHQGRTRWFLEYWVDAERTIGKTDARTSTEVWALWSRCREVFASNGTRTSCHGGEGVHHAIPSAMFRFDFANDAATVVFRHGGMTDRIAWRRPPGDNGSSDGSGETCWWSSNGSDNGFSNGPSHTALARGTVFGRPMSESRLYFAGLSDEQGVSYGGVPVPVPVCI